MPGSRNNVSDTIKSCGQDGSPMLFGRSVVGTVGGKLKAHGWYPEDRSFKKETITIVACFGRETSFALEPLTRVHETHPFYRDLGARKKRLAHPGRPPCCLSVYNVRKYPDSPKPPCRGNLEQYRPDATESTGTGCRRGRAMPPRGYHRHAHPPAIARPGPLARRLAGHPGRVAGLLRGLGQVPVPGTHRHAARRHHSHPDGGFP
jgi:hypothetical protein